MKVATGRVNTGASFEVIGQVGKVPCKLKVEFTSKVPAEHLNYLISEVTDFVVSRFPTVNFSHDRGTLDFKDIDLVEICLSVISDCEVFSCVLTLNDVQVVSSTQFQPMS